MNEFDEWQKTLFDFTMKKGRPFTASEWQVLRHCFEMRQLLAKRRPEELRLAADATTVADILEEASNQTAVSNFVSDDGALRMSVTLRFAPGGSADVYLKLSDDVRSTEGGYVSFADGDDARIKLDSRGRARIPCAEYIALLERAASIRCAGADGVERTMEAE